MQLTPYKRDGCQERQYLINPMQGVEYKRICKAKILSTSALGGCNNIGGLFSFITKIPIGRTEDIAIRKEVSHIDNASQKGRGHVLKVLANAATFCMKGLGNQLLIVAIGGKGFFQVLQGLYMATVALAKIPWGCFVWIKVADSFLRSCCTVRVWRKSTECVLS